MERTSGLSRRRLLSGAAGGLAVAALAGTAACNGGSGGGPGGSEAGTGSAQLPVYRPVEGLTPDLPGTPEGVPDGFLSYPAEPAAVTDGVPGGGGVVTALFSSFAVSPTPAPRNTYLAEMNTRLGIDLQQQVVPGGDYATRLATALTGELPDLVEILPNQPRLPQLLASTCADLTDHLSGEAVTAYPHLAAYTNDMWRTVIFDGRIFGIPVPRPVQSGVPFIRTDLFEQRGVDPDPQSWEEFREVCRALTDRREVRYALSQAPVEFLRGSLGCPAEWSEADGGLVRMHETEQYRQALARCAELYAEGLIHPDAFAANSTTLGKQRLVGGRVGIHPDGFSAWGSLARFLPEEQRSTIGSLSMRGYDGNTATAPVSAGSTNFTVIKQADDARVTELLRVLDFLAAPFGTQEFLFRKYGAEGTHHTMDGGNPTLTDRGTDEITPVTEAWDYHLVDGPKVAYEASLVEITRAKHAWATETAPGYVRNATTGLYSETFARTNGAFASRIADVQAGVITGRDPITAFTDEIDRWNAGDGQKIKQEFLNAKAAQ